MAQLNCMNNDVAADIKRIVLLEFPDEAEAYVDLCQREDVDPSAAHVISLDTKVQVWLQRRGIPCVNSLLYFTSDSHCRALRKSHALLQWMESRIQLMDGLGIRDAYSNALLWYSRTFIPHMIWLSEILSEAASQHPNAVLTAALDRPSGEGSPMLHDGERYLGVLAESFCRRQGIPFEAIHGWQGPKYEPQPKKGVPPFRWLGYSLGAVLHRAALRRMGRRRPLLAITRGYRMDSLVQQTKEQMPNLPWVVLGEGGGSLQGSALVSRVIQAVTAGLRSVNGRIYEGEIWLSVLIHGIREDPRWADNIGRALDDLAEDVEREEELFNHRNVAFGPYLAAKLRTGIATATQQLPKEVRALDEMLSLLRPRFILTPFGRRSAHALGDLCHRRGIPGLLVSHGSFTPPKDDLEEMAWAFHSYGMLHGSFSHGALQTPLAEAFSRELTTSVNFARTGPLIWGLQANRAASHDLKARLFGDQADCRVVLHAGTPKPRGSIHFHIYETTDEYVAALGELVSAVNQLPDTILVIKFRPAHFSEEELRALLPNSDRLYISVNEPFLDVLGLADLLVSFSSTTIEEALQNQVPVLLYGGDGRYQHIQAFEVTPDTDVAPGAVFAVRRSEYLADGLKRILEANGPTPLPSELFQKYIYKPEDITPFPQLVASLVENHLSEPNDSRVPRD